MVQDIPHFFVKDIPDFFKELPVLVKVLPIITKKFFVQDVPICFQKLSKEVPVIRGFVKLHEANLAIEDWKKTEQSPQTLITEKINAETILFRDLTGYGVKGVLAGIDLIIKLTSGRETHLSDVWGPEENIIRWLDIDTAFATIRKLELEKE